MVVLAVFAAVSVAVLDDYGMSIDEPTSRNHAVAAARYVLGDGDLLTDRDRYYGVRFDGRRLARRTLPDFPIRG